MVFYPASSRTRLSYMDLAANEVKDRSRRKKIDMKNYNRLILMGKIIIGFIEVEPKTDRY